MCEIVVDLLKVTFNSLVYNKTRQTPKKLSIFFNFFRFKANENEELEIQRTKHVTTSRKNNTGRYFNCVDDIITFIFASQLRFISQVSYFSF